MKSLKKMAATAAISSLLLGGSGHAALVDNGNEMIDTATNLAWLDLDQTVGLTINQALAANPGYSYATTGDVSTLFANAGFATGPSVVNASNDTAADDLLAKLGCTQFCATVNALGRGWADAGGGGNYRPFYANTGLGSQYAVISLY